MAQIPTPPASPHVENSRRAPANNSLLEPLESPNALLERYLHLLDQHQKLQEELGKQLSSGFFSLTRANYTCPPGRRYGEDYYDERMKATRKISIEPLAVRTTSADSKQNPEPEKDIQPEQDIDITPLLSFETLSLEEPPKTQKDEEDTKSEPEPTPPTPPSAEEEDDSHPQTPKPNNSNSETPPSQPEDQDSPTQESDPEAEPKSSPKPKRSRNDPLNWYGILVPPALRDAQASFTSTINGPIPALAAIVVEMRDVERKVEAARKSQSRVDIKG